MNTAIMDECFNARMNQLRGRFPLDDFRKKFVEEYARRGIVMIQPMAVDVQFVGNGMTIDRNHGFIFSNQHYVDIAIRLLRLWGFNIVQRREHDDMREYFAYIVQLPDEYLSRKISSEKLGTIHTGLRSISNVDRTMKDKQFKKLL